MPDCIDSFENEDRERVFRFFALVSRWECALKRSDFAKRGSRDQAEPDWNKFADSVETNLDGLNEAKYTSNRDFLLKHPPDRQCLEHGRIEWQCNPRREKETDGRYLFRVIRDVRNNLFHGGKYQSGPAEELARDRELLDSAIAVLEECINLNAQIRKVFNEAC